MPVDPKLRELLDTLSEEPAKARPKEEREYLVSVLRRLNIRDVPRPAEAPAAPAEPPVSYAREEELRLLREQQERDEDALRTIQAERDALRERQTELEERLARLETDKQNNLSYVDEPEPVVEFTRVDFPSSNNDELMEFQALGTTREGAFGAPDAAAWETEGDWEAESGWESPAGDWSEPGSAVEWDADEPEAPAAAPDWGEPQATPTEGAHAATGFDELDDRTKSDLAELEAQLAELERELAKRDDKSRRKPE